MASCLCVFVFHITWSYLRGLAVLPIMTRLTNRVAVVTGAASGIGRGAAIRLAAEGAAVEILDKSDASAVREEIHGAGGTACSMLCDVTNEEQIQSCVEAIGRRRERIDILVNNAGILSGRQAFHTLSRDQVNQFIQVNFIGQFLVTKAVYPLMKKSEAGRVINVASRTFFLGNPGQMAYVASKAAVIGMTRVLARELGDEGITVNAVAPALIDTPGAAAHVEDEAFNRAMMNQAIKRRGKPEDLAALIAFLASDDAELITGQFILADGGFCLH